MFQVWYRSIKFIGHIGPNVNWGSEFLSGKWYSPVTDDRNHLSKELVLFKTPGHLFMCVCWIGMRLNGQE